MLNSDDNWRTIFRLNTIATCLFEELNKNTRDAIAPYAIWISVAGEHCDVKVYFQGDTQKAIRLKKRLKKDVLALSLLFAEVFFDASPRSTSCVIYMKDGKLSVSY